ncbi:hypothetical protein BDZ45DRAFT_571056, partial [Acephala macrosclerotiorum]
MNRFRTKKNKKENGDGIARASTDSDGPSMPTIKPSKTFRLGGKKSVEEPPKPELDLTSALPSTDDFRTSLLMSGLSARFSMLREQDDPKSKIGKASDDSVLFPKRQSRMNDFGFQAHGLSDIAEVSSINGSIRPPFAYGRTDSFGTAEGYGTDDDSQHSGSIMNRAKPGESNNLFGGRQKISMGNRTLYDNDVSQSAFQKLREKERQQKEEAERLEREREENEAQASRPSSPPLSGYNRNRETSSTTSSTGPSNTRISTAATSVTSQRTPSLSGGHTPISPNVPSAGTNGLERSVTKTRRLYETGLDNHLHEQQSSAMNRIDSLTRQRTLGGHTPPPGPSPTFSHPADRWGDRVQIASKGSMPNLRGASPPPTGPSMGTFDFGVRQHTIAETKPFGMTSPPLSPPMSEHEEQGLLTIQPNDRGKATALNAFSKPAQPYDENKYSQRQLQMQQGRETSPPRKHSPPTAFLLKQQQMPGRMRAESNATFASQRSISNSSAQRNFLPHDRIPETPKQITVPENKAIASGTFLSSPNDTSTTSRVEPEPLKTRTHPKPLDLSHLYDPDQQISLERPPESQHPALRQRPVEDEPMSRSPTFKPSNLSPAAPQEPTDSPTLGPATGLSGMVRQHMRTDSNTSSVYGNVPSGNFGSRFPLDPMDPMPQNDYGTKNNPWDNDDWDQVHYSESSLGQDGAANSLNGNSFAPPPLSVRSPNLDATRKSPMKSDWQRELEIHHTRDGSSETQKEQLDFKNELASRRRQITENLKSFHESESRSASPMPLVDLPKELPMNAVLAKTNALGLLKTKTSRGSLVVRQKEPATPGQSKAMKMLGIGNATMTSSPSPGKSNFDDAWKEEEEEMMRGVQTTPPTTKAFRQARRDAQRERERQVAMKHQQRTAQDPHESEWPNSRMDNQPRYQGQSNERVPPNIRTRHRTPSRERKPPPVTYAHRNGTTSSRESKDSTGTTRSDSRPQSRTSRDRSGSDTSGGRSKSRNGRYRDDLAQAMAEGYSSSAQGAYADLEPPPNRLLPRSPGTPMGFQQSPIPSPMIPSPMMGPDPRARSNSRPGYFDHLQKPLAVQTGGDIMEIGKAPRPSPTAPFVVNPTPALVQASPAGSGTSTPTGGVPQGIGARKRSINKYEISEPRFISSTSRIDTVNLPPGSSLKNGSEIHAPPIPPVNPRRRQTRAMFGLGRKDDYEEQYSIPQATQSSEEMSTFSADEDPKPKTRAGKLRKSSSEGGNLNARAREAVRAAPSPAMPGSFPSGS